jgi:DNA-binding sugar fermentation-stimulating protein
MKQEEHQIQVAIINYLRANRIFCFAVPNGGQRNIIVAKKLKDEGSLAGVSDFIILLHSRCIFVEVKNAKGKQQDSQKDFQAVVESLGFEYLLWRSIDDAISFIRGIK